jgi:tRNA-dihydrouridine synthase B
MIGRAAQGQLWLPGAVATALATGNAEATVPSVAQQLELQSRLLASLTDFHGEFLGVRIARKHQAWFLDALVRQGALDTLSARDFRSEFNRTECGQAQGRYHARLGEYLLADGVSLAA